MAFPDLDFPGEDLEVLAVSLGIPEPPRVLGLLRRDLVGLTQQFEDGFLAGAGFGEGILKDRDGRDAVVLVKWRRASATASGFPAIEAGVSPKQGHDQQGRERRAMHDVPCPA